MVIYSLRKVLISAAKTLAFPNDAISHNVIWWSYILYFTCTITAIMFYTMIDYKGLLSNIQKYSYSKKKKKKKKKKIGGNKLFSISETQTGKYVIVFAIFLI